MILVAGVAELYQGDMDLGRRAVELLQDSGLGEDVLVEELSYGAVAVAQHLEDLRPDALVLVGAQARGRAPGSVERREIGELGLSSEELQVAVGDAVTGYVSIDLVVEVCTALGALPDPTVAIEVEPAVVEPSDRLSAAAEAGLREAVTLVGTEVASLRGRATG